MRVIRKFELLSLLLVATLFMQNASAGPVELLPESSHYQGRTYYSTYTDEGLIQGRIDFAVYDTSGENEFVDAGFTAPGDGQYIYAYQIFCDDISTDAVDYFSIVGIGENALGEPVNDNIGSVDDLTGEGIQPDDPYITSSTTHGTMGVWEFTNGLLISGKYSYFLVLRSEHNWTSGKYTFDETLANESPVPGAPEPGMLTLLGIGGAMMFTKRRKSAQRYGVYLHN